MKTLSKILLSSLFIIIVGCSNTPKEMRADVNEKGTVLINLPFDLVRENVLMQAKKCFKANLRVSHHEHVIEDIKPGESTSLHILLKGANVIVTHSFDIRKNPSGGTEISWFVGGLMTLNYRPVVEHWAKGLEGKCGYTNDK
jgi:hypothetical protein